MTAIRELIFEEIERRFGEIEVVQEVERMPSGDPVDFPALHIFDGGHRPAEADPTTSRYDMAVTVHGYIELAAGKAAHAALNELYAATVEALMPEPPLSQLVETIDEGAMQVEVATVASQRRLVFIVDFFVTFPTRRGDPAQPA